MFLMRKLLVVKATGEREEFNPDKIRKALQRSGVPHRIVDRVVSEVMGKLKPEMTTDQIFEMVYELVSENNPHYASRFDLKRGLMLLGPTGFAFEDYVSKIFLSLGYTTDTNIFAFGESGVKHELDVVAKKDNRILLIECKYHNQPGGRCDVHDVLYVWARFLDLKSQFDEAWLVTNTKFTDEAVKYASHVGLRLLGWNYPGDWCIKNIVDDKCLYPVTVIRQLNRTMRMRLTQNKVVLVRQLLDYSTKELARLLQVTHPKAVWLQKIAKDICER